MDSYNYSPNGIDYDPDRLYLDEEELKSNAAQRRSMREPARRRSRNFEEEGRLGGQERRERTAPGLRENTPAQQNRNSREGARNTARTRRQQSLREQRRSAADTAEPRVQPKPKERVPFREWGIVKFILDKRTRAVLGVALICVAVYVAIAAISWIRSGSEDQSVVAGQSVGQMVAAGAKVNNNGGPLGAALSETIFTHGLGLGSLVGLVYLVLLGLALMGIKKCSFWSLTFKSLLVAVTASLVLGLVTLWCGADISLGGDHGLYMNKLIQSYADWIGAALVSLLMVAVVIYVYLNDIARLISKYRSIKAARRAKAEQLALEQEEAREKVRKAMEESKFSESTDAVEEAVKEEGRSGLLETLGFDDSPNEEEERDPDALDTGALEISGMRRDEESDPDLIALPEERDETTDNAGYDREEDLSGEFGDENDEEKSSAYDEPEKSCQVQVRKGGITDSLRGFGSEADDSDDDDAVARDEKRSALPAPAVTVQSEESDEPDEPAFKVEAPQIEEATEPEKELKLFDPTAELSRYERPPLDLLVERSAKSASVDFEEQEENQERITKTLNDYGIPISKIKATVGPTVTLYEIIPAEGVRIAKIKRLEDDIAMSLAALGIRIIAPIPGKGTIGIEVPNKDPQTVSIRSVLGSKAFRECNMKLPMAMGATISNEVYIADLAKMPHLLVAGATGMGKSVGLNTIIASLLYKKHPAELKFVLVDPKMVEFSLYSVLERHFLAKLPDEEDAVVTDMDKVVRTLNSLCVEMDQRYMLLKDANVRSISEYNERFVQRRLNPEKGHRYLPYIVMIVDEFADLIMTAGKQVETPIARIAQKARAVGMHMIVATQRPSTNVITGIIKANFPGRIAFRVSQMVDSKTILDRTGANQLIGRGDMLFSHNGSMDRVQCAFIDTDEVQAICDHIDRQVGYEHAYYLPEPLMTDDEAISISGSGDRDPLFEEAAAAIVQSGVASTSNLQRRYSIGYNRAGKIMDQLEAAGIVGPAQGSKPRQVLVDSIQLGRITHSDE